MTGIFMFVLIVVFVAVALVSTRRYAADVDRYAAEMLHPKHPYQASRVHTGTLGSTAMPDMFARPRS